MGDNPQNLLAAGIMTSYLLVFKRELGTPGTVIHDVATRANVAVYSSVRMLSISLRYITFYPAVLLICVPATSINSLVYSSYPPD
jgi:hypothetical protein